MQKGQINQFRQSWVVISDRSEALVRTFTIGQVSWHLEEASYFCWKHILKSAFSG